MGKKKAFISVYDKENLVEFAKKLTEKYNYEIISTGGTFDFLKTNGVKVKNIAEITGFESLLNGKVKSLHPDIFAGILATKGKEQKEMELKAIPLFEMVIVNLYPFEKAINSNENILNYIDIGGVALLRAAAKNYESVTSIFSTNSYGKILEELKSKEGISLETKKEQAFKTFEHTSNYDKLIAEELNNRLSLNEKNGLPEQLKINITKDKDLRYGENPHQKAALYKTDNQINFEQLSGKELSYNNILDITAAYNILSEFIDVPTSCIIKHNNPCGVAIGESILESLQKALDCDPISSFGGVFGFNKPVTKEIAKLLKEMFIEIIIAPDFNKDAIQILSQKQNLRLIKVNSSFLDYQKVQKTVLQNTPFGLLAQTTDKKELDKDSFKVLTKKKPSAEQIEDSIFAWKVAKHVKSNAIVIAKNKATIGIGAGQQSRIASVEIALNNACDEAKDAVLASDGFFPAIDNIQIAAQSRIGAIIQPGGSIKDKDVTEAANKYGITMIATSTRHFKH